MATDHILFPFDRDTLKPSEKKKIERLFNKGGADVLDVEIDPKVKTTAGVKNRKVFISFTDSQKVTMLIKESGDVYQVMVNGTRVPMREQDDHSKSIAEIAGRLERGRTAFQKRLAKTKIRKPTGRKATPRKTAKAVLERQKALREELNDVQSEISAIKAALPDEVIANASAGDEPAKKFEYRLVRKDQYTYQIKDGRKVIDRITAVSDGWYLSGKIFDTVELAVDYFKRSRAEFLGMASEKEPKVVVTGVSEATAAGAA